MHKAVANSIAETTAFLKSRVKTAPRVMIVLGSGLGELGEQIENAVRIPFGEIPGFHSAAVEGHKGMFVAGELEGVPVVAMQGRFHLYEGHDASTAALPVRAMAALGALGGEDIKAAATRLREVADTIAVTAARFDRIVAENEGNVDRFADQGLAEFEQLLRDAREAMRSVDALTRSLERDPSRVIYGPAPAGVEIPQ